VSADSSRPGPQESSPGNPVLPAQAGSTPQLKSDLPPPVNGDREWNAASHRQRVSDFWALVGCNAIVFGASVCIMVLELTASRLIANYVGQSLYTWTSVIGVVLAGISIGNYLGGWLADKFPPQRVLPWLFVIAGLLTFSAVSQRLGRLDSASRTNALATLGDECRRLGFLSAGTRTGDGITGDRQHCSAAQR